MPLYSYKCYTCDYEFEMLLAHDDDTSPPCPNCEEQLCIRQMSAPGGFQLKGEGFYKKGWSE